MNSIITCPLANLVGLTDVKTTVQLAIDSIAKGGPFQPLLFTAQQGGGKSDVLAAYVSKAKKEGVKVLFMKSPAVMRLSDSLEWSLFIQYIQYASEGERVLIAFDEIHEMCEDKTVQLKQAYRIIRDILGAKNGEQVKLGEEVTFTVNHKALGFAGATNFPENLDRGNTSAFRGRWQECELAPYTEAECTTILQRMMVRYGLRPACDKTLAIISKCARNGSARPLQKLVERLDTIGRSKDKRTVNVDDVAQAMRLSKIYPYGLTQGEVGILDMCSKEGKGIRQNVLVAMNTTNIKESVAYLLGHKFLGMDKGYVITVRGRKYLTDIAKLRA